MLARLVPNKYTETTVVHLSSLSCGKKYFKNLCIICVFFSTENLPLFKISLLVKVKPILQRFNHKTWHFALFFKSNLSFSCVHF